MERKSRKEYLKEYRKTYSKRRVSITLDQEEYDQLVKMIGEKKPTTVVSDLVRDYIAHEGYINDDLKQEFQEMNRVIRNIANNLNQSVTAMHRANKISKLFQNKELDQLEQSRKEIKELYNSLNDYLKARVNDNQINH